MLRLLPTITRITSPLKKNQERFVSGYTNRVLLSPFTSADKYGVSSLKHLLGNASVYPLQVYTGDGLDQQILAAPLRGGVKSFHVQIHTITRLPDQIAPYCSRRIYIFRFESHNHKTTEALACKVEAGKLFKTFSWYHRPAAF
jgi:hypothetical protein